MREIVNKQKAPKDTILNNIMKEIDEENGIVADEAIEKNPKKSISKKKQKRSWLRLFFTFMFIVIVLSVLFVIYIITIATKKETSGQTLNTASRTHVVVPIKANKAVEKSSQSINLVKKEQNPLKKPSKKTLSLSEEEKEALIRKKAKEALMEQMKN